MAALTHIDVRVRDLVSQQLEWDREVDASDVAVAAKGGVVTLTGFVDSYSGKLAAERAAKRVHGVRAVANDIAVRLKLDRTDADLADDTARALALCSTVPDTVQAVVHNGHVTLTGRVPWLFQKDAAELAVRHIRGIYGVKNYITAGATPTTRDVRRRIVAAIHRDADLDAQHIGVAIHGDVATLTGSVKSWRQWKAASRAVAHAPGIRKVDNRLAIEPSDRVEAVDEIC